ncbi:MAG: hypothetical protein ACJAX3_002670, partial [Patiriisocius sp.]
ESKRLDVRDLANVPLLEQEAIVPAIKGKSVWPSGKN